MCVHERVGVGGAQHVVFGRLGCRRVVGCVGVSVCVACARVARVCAGECDGGRVGHEEVEVVLVALTSAWDVPAVGELDVRAAGAKNDCTLLVQKRVHGSLLQSISTSQLKDIGVIDPEHRWTIMRHIQALVVDNLAFGTPALPGGALSTLG